MPPEEKPKLYAQFDGDEFNGTRYALGDEVNGLDAGTREFLTREGRIGATPPAAINATPSFQGKAPADMSRAELEAATLASIDLSNVTDEQLIARLEGQDDDEDEQEQGDRIEQGEAASEPAPAPSETSTSETSGPAPFDPAAVLAGTIPDVEARLGSITDREQLEQLKTAEVAGAKRSGVSKAIDARIAALPAD